MGRKCLNESKNILKTNQNSLYHFTALRGIKKENAHLQSINYFTHTHKPSWTFTQLITIQSMSLVG